MLSLNNARHVRDIITSYILLLMIYINILSLFIIFHGDSLKAAEEIAHICCLLFHAYAICAAIMAYYCRLERYYRLHCHCY